MAAAVNFQPAFPLAFAGWTFPGYTALYTLILNLVIAIMLTPVMNALTARHEDKTAGPRTTTPEHEREGDLRNCFIPRPGQRLRSRGDAAWRRSA